MVYFIQVQSLTNCDVYINAKKFPKWKLEQMEIGVNGKL